jgi:hypothetical protein
MLRRAYRLKDTIEIFIDSWNQDDITYLKVSSSDWKHVQYLMRLLYEFWLITTRLSEHKGATGHKVKEMIDFLLTLS